MLAAVLDRAFDLRELLCIAGAQHHIRVGPVLWIEERIAPDRDRRIGPWRSRRVAMPMSPSRASARTVSERMLTPILSLGATSSSIACMIEGAPRHHDYIADPKARRPRHLVEDEISALGDARQAQARLVHLGAGRLHPFVQDGERARIAVDRHTERLRHAVGGNVTVGRSRRW